MGKSQRKWNFHVILNSLYLAFSDILPTHASPLNPHTFLLYAYVRNRANPIQAKDFSNFLCSIFIPADKVRSSGTSRVLIRIFKENDNMSK